MFKQYRKKPVIIEAFKWNGEEVEGSIPGLERYSVKDTSGEHLYYILYINTLEGTIFASEGDWIIRGTAGEIYPCKPDIFANIYEEVE